jgi:general secretion pathway protein G
MDPFAENAVDAEASWGKRSYDSPPDAPHQGADVYDVYSLSTRIGLNGIAYRDW